jgi:hypothetical protein
MRKTIMYVMVLFASYGCFLSPGSSFVILPAAVVDATRCSTGSIVTNSNGLEMATRRRGQTADQYLDDFRHLICVASIPEEDDDDTNNNTSTALQNQTLQAWKELEETVGRVVLQDACLMVAQIGLQYKISPNKEVPYLEEYLEYYLETYDCSGAELLDHVIVPAAEALFQFRSGDIECIAGGGAGNVNGIASQAFLRQCAETIKISKPVALPLLVCFIMWRDALINESDETNEDDDGHDEDDQNSDADDHENTLRILEQICKKLEGIALWMMLAGPDADERLERSLDIVDYLGYIGPTLNDDWSALPSPLDLSEGEKFEIYRALDETEFVKGVTGKKAKGILERLNEYQSHQNQDQDVSRLPQSNTSTRRRIQLEYILPEKYEANPATTWKDSWSPEEANEWRHRLGNLVLVFNQNSNTQKLIGYAKAYSEKRKGLKQSPYPLTRDAAEFSEWGPASIQACHETLLLLARKVWDL